MSTAEIVLLTSWVCADIGLPKNIVYLLKPLNQIIKMICYGLTFRFVRVQAQLRSAKENSEIIMNQILTSKRLEYFVCVNLTIHAICYFIR